MSRTVRLLPNAERDLDRLVAHLDVEAPGAAVEAAVAIRSHILSLSDFPDLGRRVGGLRRELIVPFGRGGYIVQYRVRPTEVVVARIFHSREAR